MPKLRTYDCVILGAGPAGLTAAVYLGRYNRQVLVFDMGYGRSTWFQTYSNYLGFPEGVTALQFRELGRKQAERFGVKFKAEELVESITPSGDVFVVKSKKTTVQAKTAILATGLEDTFPDFPDWEVYAGRSLYWCILCDGHYVNGQRVLCVAKDDTGVEMTMRLRQFTTKLMFLAEDLSKISKRGLAKVEQASFPIYEGTIKEAESKKKGYVSAVTLALSNGSTKRLATDAIFSRLGFIAYNDVAKRLGLKLDERGLVVVDENQETSLPGVFAAGDGATGHLHQVHAATYEGSLAAVNAYRRLYEQDFT